MADFGLMVLATPSSATQAWCSALIEHAGRLGWPVARTDETEIAPATGLWFTNHHHELSAFPGARVVLVDTSAVGVLDPGAPATPSELEARSTALVQAHIAASEGAVILNAARYRLEFPVLGWLDRPEGERYRIHSAAVESPLAIFDDMPHPPSAPVAWGPQWFSYDLASQTPMGGDWLDMTGRMRPLVFGPYICLPSGRWRVDARIWVDPERAHAPLLLEWGSGTSFCRVMAEVRRRGVYELSLDRVWSEPEVAQLRIWNAHPVFEGRLRFEGCRVTRVPDDDPTSPTPLDHIVQLGEV